MVAGAAAGVVAVSSLSVLAARSGSASDGTEAARQAEAAQSAAFYQQARRSLAFLIQHAGELPAAFSRNRQIKIAALPLFLKTYIDRVSFSFTGYLRAEKDSSTELHQWIRDNYFSFRELELSLKPQRG